ncbi:MAG: SufE family protein [Bdellovibrionales bacterium]|nr:SufE family protein [Bdellovibrionales bacterium]
MTEQELIENFSLFDQWEDRYRYIIDLGKKLPSLPQEFRTYAYKVQGCMSQVWLVHEEQDGKHYFQADSDAFIVKGLASILLGIYNGKTSCEIHNIDIESIFEKLGLSEHLSPTRRNGFFAMVKKIQSFAY